MENRNKSPRRGPGGHGPMGGGNFEKAKDFKGTVKRLLKEVRGFSYDFKNNILSFVNSN